LVALWTGLVVLFVAGFSAQLGNIVLRPIDAAVLRLREGWLGDRLVAVARAARSYHGLGPWFPTRVALYSLGVHVASAAGFYIWALALGAPAGLAEVSWAWACYTLVVLLPITFAGLGAREGVLILLLRPYGVTGADAVALSFIQLAGTLVLALTGGAYEFRTFWRRRGRPPADAVAPTPPALSAAVAGLGTAADETGRPP
jgi:uncharacterized membrane protein YbhN (UPF0104 family)